MADTETKTHATRASNAENEPRDEQGRFEKKESGAPAKSTEAKPAVKPKRTVAKRDSAPKPEKQEEAKPAANKAPATKTAAPKARENKPAKPRSDGSGGASAATGALLAVGAAGVAVGVAAMVGRKIAVQAPTVLAGDWDAALAGEHAAVLKVFDAMQATTSRNVGKRTLFLAQLKHALGKHAVQEENVIYPALRDAGHAEAADHLNHDHGYVKQYLYELENCPKDSNQFLAIVASFRTDLEKHVHEEEDELYPALKAQLSEEMNDKLTTAMNKEGFKLA